jgi:hypothetical protein
MIYALLLIIVLTALLKVAVALRKPKKSVNRLGFFKLENPPIHTAAHQAATRQDHRR